MGKWLDELMAMRCKQFARRVASSDETPKSFFWRAQFWVHWMICEFCRRYWRELREIAHLHKETVEHSHAMKQLPRMKERLHKQMKDSKE